MICFYFLFTIFFSWLEVRASSSKTDDGYAELCSGVAVTLEACAGRTCPSNIEGVMVGLESLPPHLQEKAKKWLFNLHENSKRNCMTQDGEPLLVLDPLKNCFYIGKKAEKGECYLYFWNAATSVPEELCSVPFLTCFTKNSGGHALLSDCLCSGEEDRYGIFLSALHFESKRVIPIYSGSEHRLLNPKIIGNHVYYILEEGEIGTLRRFDLISKEHQVAWMDADQDLIDYGINLGTDESFVKFRQGGKTYVQQFRERFEEPKALDSNVVHVIYDAETSQTLFLSIDPLRILRATFTGMEAPVFEYALCPSFSFNHSWEVEGSRYQVPVSLFFPARLIEKSPLIIFVHGGPHAFIDDRALNIHVEKMVEAGFAVAAVNYSGSSGYGHKYRTCPDIMRGFFETDFVTTFLSRCGLFDSEKVTFLGSSHGGFYGFWTMAKSWARRQYKWGIISLCGISDWSTRHKDPSIFAARPEFNGLNPVENAELNKGISPLFQIEADEGTAFPPMLIIHGDADDNVHFDQSTQFYKEVKKMTSSVHGFVIKGAGHFLSKTAEVQNIIQQFCAHPASLAEYMSETSTNMSTLEGAAFDSGTAVAAP